MVVRRSAAPPTPWSKNLAEPQIDSSAYVHSFSNLIGDVLVGANVLIAPGTSIRADEGYPFYIGEASNIQDGVVIHGLEKGRVIGDDQKEYSVWIGKQTCITHMALIHGPAYVGNNCFIGFRSTVFNAKVGHGCIVMMHALIQDVEIPPGKYIPSGAVITNQQQADRLPDVQETDMHFAHHVVEINEALRAGYQCAENASCINPIKANLNLSNQQNNGINSSVETMSLNGDIFEQINSLLTQGYKIGTEYATKRRFKTNSWLSGSSLQGNRLNQIKAELETILKEHEGDYVRLIGIDPQAKRRVWEEIVQRPGESPTISSSSPSNGFSAPTSYNNASSDANLSEQVRSIISQGYQIGLEHATPRRFKTKSWLTSGIITTTRESQAVQEIEATLAEYEGEYVRLIGIDPQAKQRVVETIIQRPGEDPQSTTTTRSSQSSYQPSSVSSQSSSNGSLDSETIAHVRSLLSQGYKIGTEHATPRRFKTKSWKSCSPIDSSRESEVIAALEACMNEHQGEYVRLLGIDSQAKRRVFQTIIQRPGGNQSSVSSKSAKVKTASPSNSTNSTSFNTNGSSLDREIISQVGNLLSQGYTIGTEHATPRRFKTKSWKSCSPIDSNRESEVIAALEACMNEHQGEYVRLLGIDPQAKRRVLETIIQRP